jgi:hypothetical protein
VKYSHDHTSAGDLDSIYVFYKGHSNFNSWEFNVLKGQFNIKDRALLNKHFFFIYTTFKSNSAIYKVI